MKTLALFLSCAIIGTMTKSTARASTGKSRRGLTKAALVSMYEKRIYDLEQLLDIARSFSSALDLKTLLESISFSCMAQLHTMDAGVFVLDFLTSDNFVLNTSRDPSCKSEVLQIPFADPVVRYMCEYRKPFTLDELGAFLIPPVSSKRKSKKTIKTQSESFVECAGLKTLSSLTPSLVVPLFLKSNLTGILFLGERLMLGEDVACEYSDYEKDFVMNIASLAASAINNAMLIERSSTDMMTQLKLKYFFFNVLTERLDSASANHEQLSVIMFDIDFFKHFNDTYGHECGDYVLKQVAKIIRENLREGDLASRYGGEEFTVMLNNTGKDIALDVAERIRRAIEQFDFSFNDTHMHVTISSGVTVFDVDKNPIKRANKLVSLADQGLYLSKQNGRNRVTFAEPGTCAVG